jgi:hypothetical protein
VSDVAHVPATQFTAVRHTVGLQESAVWCAVVSPVLLVCAGLHTIIVTELYSRQERKSERQGLQQEEPAPRKQRARVDAHAVAAVYDGLVRSGFLEDDVKQALQVPCGAHITFSRSSLLFAVSSLLTVRLWLCTSPHTYCYASAFCCGQPGS